MGRFIVDAVKIRLEGFREGRLGVEERGHTVLIGWTDMAVTIIQQTCIANESKGGGVVAVLADEGAMTARQARPRKGCSGVAVVRG